MANFVLAVMVAVGVVNKAEFYRIGVRNTQQSTFLEIGGSPS